MMILLKYLFFNLAICVSVVLLSESDTKLSRDNSLNEVNIIELEAINSDYPLIHKNESIHLNKSGNENSEITKSKLWLLDSYTIAIW